MFLQIVSVCYSHSSLCVDEVNRIQECEEVMVENVIVSRKCVETISGNVFEFSVNMTIYNVRKLENNLEAYIEFTGNIHFVRIQFIMRVKWTNSTFMSLSYINNSNVYSWIETHSQNIN